MHSMSVFYFLILWFSNIIACILAFTTNQLANPFPPLRDGLTQITESKQVVDLCIIGGGISGLSAAIEAASTAPNKKKKIAVLETQSKPGGRVSSDDSNGYTLDRGYAVFITEYPESKKLLDYDALQLQAYDPGALIKLSDADGFSMIADPLRQPSKLWKALTTKVGTFQDKFRLLPLFYNVKTKSIDELFEQDEIDTLTCLKETYHFSEKIISEFFEPFLVGIYFAPLDQQSSRMFHFVFKMFADGAATLPKAGMQAVSNQLMQTAIQQGVDVQLDQTVNQLRADTGGFQVTTVNGRSIMARTVICATEGPTAKKLLSNIVQGPIIECTPQRSVGCLYYTFLLEDCPVQQKLLVLNGEGGGSTGPALTVSFLHVIQDSYAPKGHALCSVSIPETYMTKYQGRETELDACVRQQLARWWPNYKDPILNKWHLEQAYHIPYAQPAQGSGCSFPANVHGGRSPSEFQGLKLPTGLYVCGDYMATATLNGAMESGINAANAAVDYMSS